ncbi:MAG: methionine synthase [Candidatus Omnitrophica bacterium]|nr:methionine synthase [Candidatus Omnitrophota bacterium]
MAKLRGLATAVGSLPHQDAGAALDLVFKYTPRIPFWPQLPKRDSREGMVRQFSEGLVLEPQEEALEKFYEHVISRDIAYFKITPDYALGLHQFYARLEKQGLEDIEFIKCQITGPFSFAASINDDKGVALLHNAVLMQAILKGLALKALWQINFFKKFGKRIIMFLDEPYLSSFGSAYTPLNRETVINTLSGITAEIKAENVLVGVHCCGNTDWSIFTDIKTIDIISFDAFNFLDRLALYADHLAAFFRRGGILCWGIVPTQEFSGQLPDLLLAKLSAGIATLAKKGVDKDLLSANMLLSPSCGMGTLDAAKAENILATLSQISAAIKNQ